MAISIVILIYTMSSNSMIDTITDMQATLRQVRIMWLNHILLKLMVTTGEIVRALQQ